MWLLRDKRILLSLLYCSSTLTIFSCLLPVAMFISCPNGGGPPVDGSQQQMRGHAFLGAIDVRAEVKLQQLSATLA
jgi:hypothetical protein